MFMRSDKVRLFDKEDTYSLRGICMIMIIIHHLYQFLNAKYGMVFPSFLSILLQDFGYLATGTFFMISGYGLAKSMDAHEPITLSYIYNHIRKLLCPFIFIYLIDVVIHSTLFGLDKNLLLYNLFTLTLSDGGTLWFMKLIFLIYVFMLSLHLIIHNKMTRLVFTIFAFVAYVILAGGYIKLYSQWWNSVLCFPLGYIFANLTCIMPKHNVGTSQLVAWGGICSHLYFKNHEMFWNHSKRMLYEYYNPINDLFVIRYFLNCSCKYCKYKVSFPQLYWS